MMINIIYRIATQTIHHAWDSDGIEISIINDSDTGIDQDMAATHHDLKDDDMDLLNSETKSALEGDFHK